MAGSTTTYEFNLPTVGSDVDLWGDYLNSNWEDIDDLLDGTSPVNGIDIDGGTIDGTPIGGTTPAAGDFTTLTAITGASGATVNSSADDFIIGNDDHAGLSILTPNTSIGSIFFGDPENNDAGRIQYQHSNNNMVFFTNGTQALRINSIGNVGIKATGGPRAKLDVAGTIAVTEAFAGANCALKLGLARADTGNSNLDLIGDTTYTTYGFRLVRGGNPNGVTQLKHRGSGELGLIAEDAGSIALYTNNTKRIDISSGGDVDVVDGVIELGLNRATDGAARIGMYGAASGATNGDFQISRNRGTNASAIIENKGTGEITIRSSLTSATYGAINLICGSGLNRIQLAANGHVSMNSLPTSIAGLSPGDLWNDSGTVKIVT